MTFLSPALARNSRLILCGAAIVLLRLNLPAQQMSKSEFVDLLLAQVKKSHFDAAESLISEKDPRSVDPLIADLKDDNPRVRHLAAMVLGEMKAIRVADPVSDARVNR